VAFGVIQHGTHQQVVHVVAGLAGVVGAQDGMANEVEVADGIKRLVLGELVAVAQTVGVQHAIVVDDDTDEAMPEDDAEFAARDEQTLADYSANPYGFTAGMKFKGE